MSDDSFSESEVEVVTHKAQGWIEATIEAAMDQPDFDSEVVKIIRDGKARLEAGKFVTGTGTNEPYGIEVALTGGASEVNSAGEALAADDVYGLLEALAPRYRARAAWQLELSTLNFIHRLWNPSGSEPPMVEGDRLVKLPYALNSSIDPYSAVDAGATASNMVLFVGDWRHYVIVDRVGLQVAYVGPGAHHERLQQPTGWPGRLVRLLADRCRRARHRTVQDAGRRHDRLMGLVEASGRTWLPSSLAAPVVITITVAGDRPATFTLPASVLVAAVDVAGPRP